MAWQGPEHDTIQLLLGAAAIVAIRIVCQRLWTTRVKT